MKIHAYDLQEGDIVTSLVLDPDEPFVVDEIKSDDESMIMVVGGYTQETGQEFNFVWGQDKALEVTRASVAAEQ